MVTHDVEWELTPEREALWAKIAELRDPVLDGGEWEEGWFCFQDESYIIPLNPDLTEWAAGWPNDVQQNGFPTIVAAAQWLADQGRGCKGPDVWDGPLDDDE